MKNEKKKSTEGGGGTLDRQPTDTAVDVVVSVVVDVVVSGVVSGVVELLPLLLPLPVHTLAFVVPDVGVTFRLPLTPPSPVVTIALVGGWVMSWSSSLTSGCDDVTCLCPDWLARHRRLRPNRNPPEI
jgi:hypothetical protein